MNDFNHKGLLRELNNSSCKFIYYNNHHPYIEDISKNKGYLYLKYNVKYQNVKKNDTPSIEIIMGKGISVLSEEVRYKNSISNNTDYVENTEKLVS